jgi:hypothetical protein
MRILLAFLMALNIQNAKQPVVKNSEATTKTEQGPQRGPFVSPHASQGSPMGE